MLTKKLYKEGETMLNNKKNYIRKGDNVEQQQKTI